MKNYRLKDLIYEVGADMNSSSKSGSFVLDRNSNDYNDGYFVYDSGATDTCSYTQPAQSVKPGFCVEIVFFLIIGITAVVVFYNWDSVMNLLFYEIMIPYISAVSDIVSEIAFIGGILTFVCHKLFYRRK